MYHAAGPYVTCGIKKYVFYFFCVCVLFFNISYIVLGKYALKMTNVIDKHKTQSRNSYVLQASSLFQVNDWLQVNYPLHISYLSQVAC